MFKMREVFEAAIALSEKPADRFPQLARKLALLHEYDPDMLQRFVEKSGMGRRKAYYLAEIGRILKQLRLTDRQVKKVGWTKLQIIAREMHRGNSKRLLQLAETQTAQQLKAKFRGDPVETGQHCMNLYFSPEQYAELEQALIANGASRSRRGRGLTNKEEAIVTIIRKAQHSG